MKTSIKALVLLLALILVVSAGAQEQTQGQSGEAAEEADVEAAERALRELEEEFAETQVDPAEQDPQDQAGEQQQDTDPDVAATIDQEPEDTAGEAQNGSAESTEAAAPEPSPVTSEPAAVSAETFVFQGHPIFPPHTAELVYRPLVNYLNDALPYRFDLELSPDYHRYWLSTRRGENPHLVLEEPHLTAFRMQKYGYSPLVRAEQPITYSLLTSMNNAEYNVRDFVGRRISTMPAPSLGYLILTSWFDNPMQQPIIQSNAASWMDAVEIVFSQEADAAIVPRDLVSRYVNMANVLTSQEFPGVTISASSEVPADIQAEIRTALLNLHEDEEHFVALNELDVDRFIEAPPEDYEGLDEWLRLVYSVL